MSGILSGWVRQKRPKYDALRDEESVELVGTQGPDTAQESHEAAQTPPWEQCSPRQRVFFLW